MYKTQLQELCHRNRWNLPEYVTVKDGPDHSSRFNTRVTVNNLTFETPANQCRSSKQSQNEAARIAFTYFSAIQPFPQPVPQPAPQTFVNPTHHSSNPQIDPSFSGFLTSTTKSDTKFAKSGIVEQTNPHNIPATSTSSLGEDEKDKLHLYKSRLQIYAQKKSLSLPTYSSESMGPPHARRFKAKVFVDGKCFETSTYFTTLKDAEHAVAKIAFESLSHNETPEEEGLYKSLLQQLAQKRGARFPSYETEKSGPPHMPSFISTVEIGGEIFRGHEAKTKKLAEMNAAKAAYTNLTENQARQSSTVPSPGFHNEGATINSSFDLQPNVMKKVESNAIIHLNNSSKEQAGKIKEVDINGKRHRNSSSYETLCAEQQGSTSSEVSPSKELSPSVGAHCSATKRIQVCPTSSCNPIPGGTILMMSDDQWTARDLNQDQQLNS